MQRQYRLTVYRGKWCLTWHDGGTRRHSTGLDGVEANRAAAEVELKALRGEMRRSESKPVGPVTVDRCLSGYFEARPNVYPRPSLLTFFSNVLPEHVDRRLCQEYAASRVGKAASTVRDELGYLRSAMRWAEVEGWGIQAPRVWRPSGSPARDRWLTPDEAQRLINSAVTPHIRLFVLLALHTAARSGAILGLTWDRVSFDLSRIDLNQPGKSSKLKKRAVVPMSDDLRVALQDARRAAVTGPVIRYADEPVASIKRGFRHAVTAAGLKGVTPHTLRHTAATWMAQSGVPLWEIAGMLGNSVRMVEQVYAKHHPDYLAGASAAVSSKLRSARPVQSEPRHANDRGTS